MEFVRCGPDLAVTAAITQLWASTRPAAVLEYRYDLKEPPADLEFCPSVSRDGKYLFFTSNRPKTLEIEDTTGVREELGLTPSPERPDIDIYWVDAGFIESFRPQPQ